MDWRAVVCSGAVEPTESNIGATEPILDIRHSCVKSESPTVVHQSRPHSLTPQSAEVVLPDDIVVPPELLSYHMAVADVASPGTTNLEQLVSYPLSVTLNTVLICVLRICSRVPRTEGDLCFLLISLAESYLLPLVCSKLA